MILTLRRRNRLILILFISFFLILFFLLSSHFLLRTQTAAHFSPAAPTWRKLPPHTHFPTKKKFLSASRSRCSGMTYLLKKPGDDANAAHAYTANGWFYSFRFFIFDGRLLARAKHNQCLEEKKISLASGYWQTFFFLILNCFFFNDLILFSFSLFSFIQFLFTSPGHFTFFGFPAFLLSFLEFSQSKFPSSSAWPVAFGAWSFYWSAPLCRHILKEKWVIRNDQGPHNKENILRCPPHP